MMFHVQGASKHTCGLLAVLSGRSSEYRQKQGADDGLRYPFPEIVSSGRLEVQTLNSPSIEEFHKILDSSQPNFVYLQGEQLPNDEVGSLVWGGIDVSTAEAVAGLFGSTLPTTVYLEIPNGEKLAEALQSKGIPYVIYWKNAFSRYAACHFRHALFSVVQSSSSHTWDAFQLAHASLRLYCVRNNLVLPGNSQRSNDKLVPYLLGDPPVINVTLPEIAPADDDESSLDGLPAIKIYDDDVNMKFLVCGVACTLDACLLGSLEDGLNALLSIEMRGSKLHNRVSALPPPLQAGTFSRGVVTMRCDLSTCSSAHISLLVSGSAQTCFDDLLLENHIKSEVIEKSQLVHTLPNCEENKPPLSEPRRSASIACGAAVFEVCMKVPSWASQVLRQLAPDVSYRSLVALGIASIQGLAVASFEKDDAERLLFFCTRPREDLSLSNSYFGNHPSWLRPPIPSRKRHEMCRETSLGFHNGLVSRNLASVKRENREDRDMGLTNGVNVPFRQKLKVAAMRPIPHIRHQKMLPFSATVEGDGHEGGQVKANLSVAPSSKHSVAGSNPVTHRKSYSNSFQAKQIISLNPLPLKKHGCDRSPIHVCSEEEFLKDVMQFLILRGHTRLIPQGGLSEFPDAILNAKRLDLFNLYREVVSRGGFHVGNGINWKGQVFSKMRNHTVTNRMTGVGNTLKRHYETYLLDKIYNQTSPPSKNRGRRRGRGGRKSDQGEVFMRPSSRPCTGVHKPAGTGETDIPNGSIVNGANLCEVKMGFPSSSKSLSFAPRPGYGQLGTKCVVKANHFFAELPDKDLNQYDVTITPEVASRNVNRAIMAELVKLYKESGLGKRLPAYDGRKSLYTAGELPFAWKEFNIKLVDEEDGINGPKREREYKVVIKFVARANLHHLGQFLAGKRADAPQEALQILDIVLRELSSKRYCPVGRSFFSPDIRKPQRLGDGLESWCGFYQSIRPTQMGLSLNIDMASAAFIEALPIIEFVAQLLGKDVISRTLSDSDRVKIKKALRGVKVEVTHRGNVRRKYRVSGLTSQPTRELVFPVDDNSTMKSVVEYFQEMYGFTIQHTHLPCLQVGNQKKANYLPMEACKIVGGQRYTKRLNEKQITALLKVTCQRPRDRENDILQTVQHNAYDQDPYAKEFGIKISEKLASVEARVLPAPWLKYHETGKEKDCLPQVGQWNMMNKKMINGMTVSRWACINFSRSVQESVARGFCIELAQMCQVSGMEFNPEPVIPIYTAKPEQVEKALKHVYHVCMNKLKGKELELLLAILPDNNGSLYGDIKRICETDLGLISQCCLTKHVFKITKQYLANVSLKINVKMGGRNTVLLDAISCRIPLVSDIPTIIFGADVTHPENGEDSSPSIAAVVASQDWPEVTKYAGLVCAQAHRQELIQDLYKTWHDPVRGTVSGGMIRDLLVAFRKATGQKPLRIIFYRDGVSEGQFYQVLLYELDAIRKACASLEPNYQPPVTFIVVQKRHHTRLFANNHRDRSSTDKSGNILPGTVVDSKICHPTEFDFYLCSHAGIQGTSRPAHYHVLWDENNFTADGIQSLTNNLCYTYARCTRSVSVVPPAYYAHLAAFRARFYMEPDLQENGSGGGQVGKSTRANGETGVRPLPALKENVKRVMFYC